jgi:hypothetical protein
MEKNLYLVIDGINSDHHECSSVDEAKEIILEIGVENGEGIHPDIDCCSIYKKIIDVEINSYNEVIFNDIKD